MTYQFTETEQQVFIKSEYNTQTIYLTADDYIDRRRTVLAILKYRCYHKAVPIQEAISTAARRVQEAPQAFWLNVTSPIKHGAASLASTVRHYVLLSRIPKHKVI